ncbi:MAG: hypothetical protein QW614_00940 [Candidatus Caldarchaeum sp.]|uniref:Uncharacterized protein n=1 Tax=Caldiarchaeum subterraneum TaxID=311458 RepID=A0A7C5Q6B6_CALS0
MSEEDAKADIMDKIERLYSIVNRARFYRDVAMESEWSNLMKEVESLRVEMKLAADEVEKLADDLDEYYISGSSAYGETDPLTHWADIIYQRLFKT